MLANVSKIACCGEWIETSLIVLKEVYQNLESNGESGFRGAGPVVDSNVDGADGIFNFFFLFTFLKNLHF